MRTVRTVLVVLCLVLATSTVATAAPSETVSGVEGRSFTSWVMSAFDWLLASFPIEEVVARLESDESDKNDEPEADPLEGEEQTDEYGGALEPNG